MGRRDARLARARADPNRRRGSQYEAVTSVKRACFSLCVTPTSRGSHVQVQAQTLQELRSGHSERSETLVRP